MMNSERLADTFKFLVEIDSVSKEEGHFAGQLRQMLEGMGATTFVDDAGKKIGSDTGNLFARFPGNMTAPPLLLNAHMDTVEPGRGIRACLRDGKFTSDGTTILGADDKSAIAVILETITQLQETGASYGPLELVFTICEEIGLQGVKHLDFSRVTASYGYTLDATDTEGIVTRAPGANHLELTIHGKDAHAGAAPENGINAIVLASRAIAKLDMGRIDHETTANVGVIEGGIATNIVPNRVVVKGEVRSHDREKLQRSTDRFVSAFQSVVDGYAADAREEDRPTLEARVSSDFSRTHIPEDHPVVVLAQRAAGNLGREMRCKTTGGGADANIFFEKGIMMGVLGTGMRDMHTVRESVQLEDMHRMVRLMVEIITLHAKNPAGGAGPIEEKT